MQTIIIESKVHIIVLKVRKDSPRKYQVKTGKIRYETPNAKNLTDHRDLSKTS
tara:strand:+ start:49 stop:207 length:159 start_codon:yes stop_codon:yes gene_type:complete